MLFFLLSCILEFVLDSLTFWSFWRVFRCMNFNLPGCSHHPRHLYRFVAECVQSTSVGIFVVVEIQRPNAMVNDDDDDDRPEVSLLFTVGCSTYLA